MQARNQLRNRVVRLAMLLLLLTVAPAALAQEESRQFDVSIMPNRPNSDPAVKPYFIFENVAAGSQLAAEARIVNVQESAVTLHLYPSDVVSADRGGYAYNTAWEQSTEQAGQWLSVAPTTLTLQPSEEYILPFTVDVPANVKTEQVAGIVLQEVGETAADTGRFGITVIERRAMPIVIRPSNAAQAQLQITDLQADSAEIENGVQALTVQLSNIGEVGLKGEGVLHIRDGNGVVVHEAAIGLRYFAAGEQLAYQVALAEPLDSADYAASVTLTYYDHLGSIRTGKSAEYQTELSLAAPAQLAAPLNWTIILIVVAVLLVLLVIALLIYWQSRRMNEMRRQLAAAQQA